MGEAVNDDHVFSMLCQPIRSPNAPQNSSEEVAPDAQEILGVCQLVDKRDSSGKLVHFDAADEELLNKCCSYVSQSLCKLRESDIKHATDDKGTSHEQTRARPSARSGARLSKMPSCECGYEHQRTRVATADGAAAYHGEAAFKAEGKSQQ